MNLKQAPVYSKMVEDMLHLITKIQHSVKLECKWEVLSYKFNMGRIICISRESDRMKTDRLGLDRLNSCESDRMKTNWLGPRSAE